MYLVEITSNLKVNVFAYTLTSPPHIFPLDENGNA